jgi:esterase/lipase
MNTLKSLGKIFLICYALLCLMLWFAQDFLIFRPHTLPENHRFRTGEEIEIKVAEDVSLNCLWMKEAKSKGVVLYLHGNRGSNRRCLHQARNMSNNGYDIFMPDYRGYGKSDGKIYSEKQLLSDIQKVYDFLKEHYEENQIILSGYSLGSGMASWLAANNQPQQLVMIAPYESFYDLKKRYIPFFIPNFLVKYPLNSAANLTKVNCPVTLFHGTNDEVIPYDSSKNLAALNPSNIKLVTLKNERHRGAIFNGIFRRKFKELVR